MRKRIVLWVLFCLLFAWFGKDGQAQNPPQPTLATIQPDCLIPFTLAAAGNFPATTVAGGPGDNRTKGCAAWTLMYQNTGMTSVTVTLQSASTTGTSPSFGSFAGTISTGYVNPIVSDTGGSVQATNGTADISWVRVNVAATGTGTLTGVLYGFRNSSAAVNAAPAVSITAGTGISVSPNPITGVGVITNTAPGAPPAGPTGCVQLTDGATALICDPGFIDYSAGIPDPNAPTVVPTCSGTCMTTYSYAIGESNGTGFTASSPASSASNATSLSGANFNTITLPLETDPNITCIIFRSAGPGSTRAVDGPVVCDGSTFDDNSPTKGFASPVPSAFVNTTAGLLVTAGGVKFGINSQGLLNSIGSPVQALAGAIGPIVGVDYNGKLTGQYLYYSGSDFGFQGVLGFKGWYQNVTPVTTSPYSIISESPTDGPGGDGFLKCDASGGSITLNLPNSIATDQIGNPLVPLGRAFTLHKPTAGNSCTLATTDGTTIDGAPTYVITNQNDSVSVYWDGGMWATSSRLSFDAVLGRAINAQLPATLQPTTGYNSQDGTSGTTGNGFKNGLCVTASGACVGGAAFPAGTTTADEQCWASASTFGVCANTTISGRATEGSATLTADVVNPFINTKNTQTATAPGAGKADLRWIAGTIAGTCKLVANAGTSATEVTIVDSVGGGC